MNGNSTLEQRYLAVRHRIRRAAEAAGRDPDLVHLLAVSKTFSAGAVAELAAAGQPSFGENYLQEALGKMAALAHLRPGWQEEGRPPASAEAQAGRNEGHPGVQSVLQWHFIGPIQSNKTRKIAEAFDWVQSVSEERIARRLSEQRPAHLAPLNICLQVNVSGEASKSGCEPDQALDLALAVATLPNLRLRGLMAIPEPTQDRDQQARRFAGLKALFEQVRLGLKGSATDGDFDTLSMGMSADLEAAIAQGATLVRVGSALFGERPKGG